MQRNNRLGCLTGTGLFAALITLFTVVGVAFASGSQMFSAGPLNNKQGEATGGVNSHAQIKDCKTCHTAPWERATMADRCLHCHSEIGTQLTDPNQLHGAIMKLNPGISCRQCHPEHRGASAPLTEMNNALFPHETLGFSLNGHQFKATQESFVCSDCHAHDLTTFASDSCQNCHSQIDIAFTQAHALSFGTDCLACHDGVDRFGDDFNHNHFHFQLIGKHAEASCTKCHLDARSLLDLQSAPQDCFSCHSADDAHQGRFGLDCGSCHSPAGWKPAKFDHNLSDFKLEGQHVEVSCDQCHVNNVFKGTPKDCYSCHRNDDEHNGQFGTQCGACHNPSDWENVNVDHSLFAFKLEGKHSGVKCDACHQNGVFKGAPQDCYSCHRNDDKHNGQFGNQCDACHNPSGWENATFDHNLSAFKLNGAHAQVRCEQCHVNGVFKGTPKDCYSCHRNDDNHNGKFGTDCSACHTTSSWKGATFDHSKSAFPLTGAHVNVKCESCHKNGQFSGLSSSCASCHGEPAFHAGMFSSNCADCHNTKNWYAPYRGSHPGIADEGGRGVNHGGATCRTCHVSTLRSATCTACHKGNNFDDD